jgi:hypothetical protein
MIQQGQNYSVAMNEDLQRWLLNIESFKTFAIVTDHVLVQMQIEISDLQNNDTEGHTQQRHGSLPENRNAMLTFAKIMQTEIIIACIYQQECSVMNLYRIIYLPFLLMSICMLCYALLFKYSK